MNLKKCYVSSKLKEYYMPKILYFSELNKNLKKFKYIMPRNLTLENSSSSTMWYKINHPQNNLTNDNTSSSTMCFKINHPK